MSRFWYVRSARTTTLLIAALVFLGSSVTALVVCLLRLNNGTWPEWVAGILDSVKNASWSDAQIFGIGIGLAAIGLLLLVAALLPGNRRTALLEWDSAERREEWTVDREGLANLARYEAERTDGVHRAIAKFRGKELKVRISTPVHEVGDVRTSVEKYLQEILASIPLAHEVKVNARVQRKGER